MTTPPKNSPKGDNPEGMTADRAKEIVFFIEEDHPRRAVSVSPLSTKNLDDYKRAKGYLAALSGPEVGELVEAAQNALRVLDFEYGAHVTDINFRGLRESLKHFTPEPKGEEKGS